MRQFYLREMNDDEVHIIVSAPRQEKKGDKAYGSQITQVPAQMTIISIE